MNAPEAGEARVPADVLARSDQSVHHVVEIGDQNAGMTFPGRSEIVFDSEMQFDGASAESRSAACREGGRLVYLDHAQHADEEISGALLLIPRHCQLQMVEPVQGHEPNLPQTRPARHWFGR